VSRALLDINVLVALFDPDHVHHDIAHDWFADHRAQGWASCPITQNGLIRVLSNPRYGSPVSGLRTVREAVRRFVGSKEHEFWPDDISLSDNALFDVSAMVGHKQLTDVYLLGPGDEMEGPPRDARPVDSLAGRCRCRPRDVDSYRAGCFLISASLRRYSG
jgi:toxin-antitoxin system PIN domain toxin